MRRSPAIPRSPCRSSLRVLNEELRAEAEAAGREHIHVAIGIGLNTGLASVGNLARQRLTTASLKSIFAGRLEPHVGDPSCSPGAKNQDHGVAIFSGQPEDFGDISRTSALRRSADVFVDAEKRKDKRWLPRKARC